MFFTQSRSSSCSHFTENMEEMFLAQIRILGEATFGFRKSFFWGLLVFHSDKAPAYFAKLFIYFAQIQI